MARKSKNVVGVSAVREFHKMPLNQRGRVSREKIEAYEKATGNTVQTGFKPEKTVTLRPTKVQKNGKRVARPVTKSLSEARALAGETAGSRGVLSAKARTAAEAALSDPLTDAEIAAAAAEVASE